MPAAVANGDKAGKASAAGKMKRKAEAPQQPPAASDASDESGDDDDAEPLELELDNFGRPHGVKGMLDYEFRSIHRALRVPDDKSYLDLVADCEVAFTAREIENAEYSTGSTFFLPATMEPRYKGKDAITLLDLTFIEASRHMSLKLPVPVSALQAEVKKTPQVSSFEIAFPTTAELKAELIAGDEVEEEDDDSDEEEEEEEDEEEDGDDDEEEEEEDEDE
ncbi:hypothetical protein ATCC90586_000810 [Pythium insidiosum]|nr:hypothetical protein ATCC90586_000810 [Pythium insidiosum]